MFVVLVYIFFYVHQNLETTTMIFNRSTDNKFWYIHTVVYCSAIKRNKLLINTYWWNLTILLCGRNQTQRKGRNFLGTESRLLVARKLREGVLLMGHSRESLGWYHVLYGILMEDTWMYTFVKIDRHIQYIVNFTAANKNTKSTRISEGPIDRIHYKCVM